MNRTLNVSGSVGGQSINGSSVISGTRELGGGEVTLPAADTGTISSAVITVTSNAGVPNSTSAATGHVFWIHTDGVTEKRRYNCTFVVNAATVTVSDGVGDTLPTSGTVYCINSTVVSDNQVTFDGTANKLLMYASTQRCSIQFNTSAPAVLYETVLSAGQAKSNVSASDINGIVATITAANGSPTASTFQWGILLGA